jgi:hypothetical protein
MQEWSEDAIRKIRATVHKVEGLPPVMLGSADYDVDAGPPIIEVVLTTTGTPDGNGWYTAQTQSYDVTTNTFTAGSNCLLKEINDNTLEDSTYYLAKAWDYDEASGKIVWLTQCCGSGGGGGGSCCSDDEPPGTVLAGPTSGPDAPPTFRTLDPSDIPPLPYVTSAGVTVPSPFSASGSPITSSGTIAITIPNQSPNEVYSGPSSGGSAAPAFRTLVPADIPALPYASSGAASAGSSGSGTATTTLTTIAGPFTGLGTVGLKNTGSVTLNYSTVCTGAFGTSLSTGSSLGAGNAVYFDIQDNSSNPHDSGPTTNWQLKVNTSSGTTTYAWVARVV